MSFLAFVAQNADRILTAAGEHLAMATLAVLCAVALAVPVGIVLTRREAVAQYILGATNIIMTVPSLALLALMIPLLGIGKAPAVVALFLYALMPMLRNTYVGIKGVDASLIEAGRGMGMTNLQLLWLVELPIALPVILAGIRTTYVIIIGWTTLAALIGGGGLGQLIWAGITTINTNLVLAGAVPAALLAVLADYALGRAERWIIPRGLQKRRESA
ncbi:MAG TPA: ABC transporter permease [Bacillota bacterium]